MRNLFLSRASGRVAGVTLIELVITIAIVGILGAIIVQFVQPVRSYIDTSRRAALADTADTALRRIARDLRLALPNSVRIDTSRRYVEFMLVRTGGRYRYDTDTGASNTCTGGYAADILTFAAADTCFKTLGNIPNLSDVTTSDYVVVFNMPTGTDKADVYQSSCGASCNKSQISAKNAFTGEDRIEFASNTFTYESPGRRFFIVEGPGPVTYGCNLTAGTLTRYWGYTIPATQTNGGPPTGGGSSALMASGVTDCEMTYDSSLAAQGAALVTMSLTLSAQDSRGDAESVTLYHAVHVNNVP
ncbi:MAG: prepilin-type N-terminal cleavage/methylation domain-containing protein [Betaproteobacteria bacterium]|nr:prepilin-type N-terminal cleavage/methylation domain-containing protein [Betaproteobacteria bacterium]